MLIGAMLLAAPVEAAPLDPPVMGPKLVCFEYSTFFLKDGERIVDFESSPEAMLAKIESPSARYEIGESGGLAPLKTGKRLVSSSGKTSVFRNFGRERRYEIYGPTSFPHEGPVLFLSVKSGTSDRGIYSRIEVRDPKPVECGYRFIYG
ncbi:MAG TPA: hypothetical protein VG889_22630 [Rhizomicrobium sp.]|nr:hypothetical protein [Rhizomicrobium sp.]